MNAMDATRANSCYGNPPNILKVASVTPSAHFVRVTIFG